METVCQNDRQIDRLKSPLFWQTNRPRLFDKLPPLFVKDYEKVSCGPVLIKNFCGIALAFCKGSTKPAGFFLQGLENSSPSGFRPGRRCILERPTCLPRYPSD